MLEEDEEIDLGVRAAADPRREILELDEQEALRQREVLAQQPIANEGLARAGRERLIIVEAMRPHRTAPDDVLPGVLVGRGLADHADAMGKQLLVQPIGEPA